MDNWSKLKKLNRKERKLLVQALFLLPFVHWLLSWMGYVRLTKLIEKSIQLKLTPEKLSESKLLERAEVAAHMVSIAAHHGFFQASCLRRSLALAVLLRRENIPSEICFGLRLSDQNLEAHAWVEVQGTVVNDRPDIRQQYSLMSGIFPAVQKGL
jgi:hypothetical protein